MNKFHGLFLFIWCIPISLYSQIIQTEPSFPSPDESVVILYDATQGNAALEDYSGDVYAHTGLITEESTSGTDWKYEIADWDENVPEAKMERIEPDLYELEITPSIREFYGVPEDEKIEKMAFVFRNEDGSLEGKTEDGEDIFVEVYEKSFNAKFIQPQQEITISSNPDPFQIEGTGSSDSTHIELSLSINDSVVHSVVDDTISYEFNPEGRERYEIALIGTDGNEADTARAVYIITPETTDEERPADLEDGITYVDDNTVILSLFAPYKEFVYLIGDFNDWEVRNEYFMKRDSLNPDSVYYWTEIDGLTPGEEYAFQYFVDGEIRVTDPYVGKVLDEYNDKYISEETYPDLKPYPAEKTNKIAGVLQPGKEEYEWQHSDYERPNQEELVIYELLIRDFIEKHDFQTLVDTLDYIERLGVNAIELMPVMEFDGNNSWGYNPTFHMAVDKYYGPADDLKAFIDECHSRGIAVILDMVLNHAWGPSPLVRLWNEGDYGKPTPENPYLNVEPKHDFNVGYDFNHESAATQYFVDRVNKHWIEEFKFDGYRFDLSKGFTQQNTLGDVGAWGEYDASRVDILERMADEIWNADSEAYVILEHFAENNEEETLSDYGMMLWGNLNHNYSEAAMGYHSEGKSDFSGISYTERDWADPHVVGYMESHDEERMMYKNINYGNSSGDYDIREENTALKRIQQAAAFFLPIPGPKLIWQFGELGYDYSIDYDCRTCPKPIRWEYYTEKERKALYNTFRVFNHLRNTYEVFATDDFDLSVSGSAKRIVLRHSSFDVVIVGNFGVEPDNINPAFTETGTWYELFSQDSIEVEDVNSELSMGPGEFRFYSSEYIDITDVVDSEELGDITTVQNLDVQEQVQVYPNPAREIVKFKFDAEGEQNAILNIYSVNGQKITTLQRNNLTQGENLLEWNESVSNKNEPAIYFYELLLGNKRFTGKFLKY
ncbi:MAG: alpha-amylase family glycosyl hydrolase [Bacteroidales bacterium]